MSCERIPPGIINSKEEDPWGNINRHKFCHYTNGTYIGKVKSLTIPGSPNFII